MSTGAIVLTIAVAVAFAVILAEPGDPVARLFTRTWLAVRNWVEDTLHLHWVNEAVWRWEDRRRAVRMDELASLADSAGLAETAAMAREAAARARLRAAHAEGLGDINHA